MSFDDMPAANPTARAIVDTAAGDDAVPTETSGEFDHLDADKQDPVQRILRSTIEWLVVIIGALTVALLLRAYVFQVFHIPSSSMVPTLQEGDRIVVNKLDNTPERGDVIVFGIPDNFVVDDETEDLVKRVIGLPGETVALEEGSVFIDGTRLDEPYLTPGTVTEGNIWHERCANAVDNGNCEIPEGSYLVLGDNRPASQDGRKFGPIGGELIQGGVALRVYPLGDFGGV